MVSESRDNSFGPAFTVYVDESGNTGDAAKIVEAFGGQPAFALVGIGEPSDTGLLGGILDGLRRRHRIQAPEFKSSTLARHPGLGLQLVRDLLDASVPIFIELMDKSYYLAMGIVTHFLGGPWFELSSQDSLDLANSLAELLTHQVPSGYVQPYLAFAQNPNRQTLGDFETSLRECIAMARRWAPPPLPTELDTLLEVLEVAVKAHDLSVIGPDELLPPPDIRGNTRYAMLPHVNAFAHLYARVNRAATSWAAASVVHDEQPHVRPILQEYAALLESNAHMEPLSGSAAQALVDWDFSTGKVSLSFANSHEAAGIQVADLVAGMCTRRLASIIEDRKGDLFGEEVRLLASVAGEGLGLNAVTSHKRVKSLRG